MNNFARKLRKAADLLDTPGAWEARRRRIPLNLYRFFRRVEARGPIRTVLDVGANRGEFARYCAECFPHAAIHAFEPLPACQAPLQRVAAANPRIRVHTLALGDRTGEAEMFENDYDPLLRVLHGSRQQVVAPGSAPSLGGALTTFSETLTASRSWPSLVVAAIGAVVSLSRRDRPRWSMIQSVWFATFIGTAVLTSDYLLPSVRGHIKEMAYVSPLLVVWEAVCIVWLYRSGSRSRRVVSMAVLALLGVLSISAVYRLLTWSLVF